MKMLIGGTEGIIIIIAGLLIAFLIFLFYMSWRKND